MTDYYEQEALWDRDLTEQEIERIELVSEIIPEDVETILDAGCGSGTLTNYIQGYTIVGVDRSKEALKHYKHEQLQSSLDDLLFEDDAFDLVICSDVLEHLPADIYIKTIKELKRVAKKYILIISPNKEDLEANQCKCESCDTVFHINWHIRSLGIEDIITLFRDDYSPLIYTYFGEPWASEPPVKYQFKRSVDKGYKHWENAVCPLCQAQQSFDTEEDEETDQLFNKRLGGFYNRSTEVMVLLSTIIKKNEHFDFDTLLAEEQYLLLKEKNKSATIAHRQYINTGHNAFFKKATCDYPASSYIIHNSENDWIKSVVGDEYKCSLYKDNNSSFQHALFVMPYLQQEQILFVKYIDIETDEQVQINLYCIKEGYVHLKTLDFKGTQEVKIVSVAVPNDITPANPGLQFEIVTVNREAPVVPVPFLEFYMNDGCETVRLQFREKVHFHHSQYYFYNCMESKQKLADSFLLLNKGDFIYHHRYKCFYWNLNSVIEFQDDIQIKQIIFKDYYSHSNTQRIDCRLDTLAGEQNSLTKQLSGIDNKLDQEIYSLRETLYGFSNTMESLLYKINHPLRVVLDKLRRLKPKKQINPFLKNKKHLVIITPDVNIDRRTVQMCQSIIKEFDIRCTIIAALEGTDNFVTEMLQVKRIDPRRRKNYSLPDGAWKDSLNVDLPKFYWLHSQFLSAAADEDADYMMCCDLPVLPAATYVAKLKNIPLIYDAHELYPEQEIFARDKQLLYKKVENEFIQYPDLVITVNKSIAREIAREYGISEPKVILNALDSTETFNVENRYDYFREKLPIVQKDKIVLFQGGYSPNRNLELFVESAKDIQNDDVVLVLMGFGEYQKELEKIARDNETLDKKVFFFPAVDQSVLLEYSASADVGIIPYPHIDLNSYFCTPNKLFEFIQAGLPMITNDSPELNRFVKENEIGFARKMDNAKDIAEIIDAYFEQDIDYRANILLQRKKICWTVEEARFTAMLQDVIL